MSLRSLSTGRTGKGDGYAEILVDRDIAVHDYRNLHNTRCGEGGAGRDRQRGRRGIGVLGHRNARRRCDLRQVHGGRDLLSPAHGDDLGGAAARLGRIDRARKGVGIVGLND